MRGGCRVRQRREMAPTRPSREGAGLAVIDIYDTGHHRGRGTATYLSARSQVMEHVEPSERRTSEARPRWAGEPRHQSPTR